MKESIWLTAIGLRRRPGHAVKPRPAKLGLCQIMQAPWYPAWLANRYRYAELRGHKAELEMAVGARRGFLERIIRVLQHGEFNHRLNASRRKRMLAHGEKWNATAMPDGRRSARYVLTLPGWSGLTPSVLLDELRKLYDMLQVRWRRRMCGHGPPVWWPTLEAHKSGAPHVNLQCSSCEHFDEANLIITFWRDWSYAVAQSGGRYVFGQEVRAVDWKEVTKEGAVFWLTYVFAHTTKIAQKTFPLGTYVPRFSTLLGYRTYAKWADAHRDEVRHVVEEEVKVPVGTVKAVFKALSERLFPKMYARGKISYTQVGIIQRRVVECIRGDPSDLEAMLEAAWSPV